MYEARKIANLLLATFDAEEYRLTNLRMNKLLFFIHAEALRSRPDGIIRNHFEAWQFGPVIRPIFDAFKGYNDAPISAPAQYLDYSSGKTIPVPYDDIAQADVDFIEAEFRKYSGFTTGQLVQLSHEAGGPWDIIYRAQLADKTLSPRIPNDLIRRHLAGQSLSTTKH